MKIAIDPALCDGHGQCIAVAAGLFDLDGAGRSVVIGTPGEDQRPAAELAAAACPAEAITVQGD